MRRLLDTFTIEDDWAFNALMTELQADAVIVGENLDEVEEAIRVKG
jgi:hypothetical protein